MANSEASEEFSDWEEIQYPQNDQPASPPPPPPPPPREHPLLLEMVTRVNVYDDGSSIFPPSEHEDLPVVLETPSSPSELALPVSEDPPQQQQIKSDSKSKLSHIIGEIRTGISTTGRRMSLLLASCFKFRRCTSLVPAVALAIAIFACVKILQWRNRLLLLIREKDKRISQLLHQIAHMNEILSARRRVPLLAAQYEQISLEFPASSLLDAYGYSVEGTFTVLPMEMSSGHTINLVHNSTKPLHLAEHAEGEIFVTTFGDVYSADRTCDTF